MSDLIRLLRRSWLITWAPELPFTAVQVFAAQDPVLAYVLERWQALWVADLDDEIVGCLDIERDVVATLDVDPDRWRRGIGSILLEQGEALIARSHTIARLEVRAFNTRAIQFYNRHGWLDIRRYIGTECGAAVETIEMHKAL